MGSYYREHLHFPPQHNLSPFHPQDAAQPPPNDQPDPDSSQGPTRLCSVRGCTTVLPFEYALKMCEQCRGRHRIYANTKRQKRKLEKMALGGQRGPVVWMPPDEDQEGEDTEPHADLQTSAAQQHVSASPVPAPEPPAPAPQPQPQPSPQQHYNLPSTPWDNSAIDPRLFTQPTSSSSELAGALILPGITTTHQPRTPHDVTQQIQSSLLEQNPTPLPPVLPSMSTRFSAQPGPQGNPFPAHQPTTSTPETPELSPHGSNPTPRVEISARAISEAAAQLGEAALPHRYCSIKGCKTVIPGDSFFKMCEPCRNRYRNYGTTKRAKWRREKEAAVAELQNLRAEEDKRRAENGLPPLPREEIEWQDIPAGALESATLASRSPFAQVVPSHAPRMCTVSHCREILPADYEYLRCERHRIQNRHHSKLKRVRDKESKAVAFDDWAAAVGAMSQKKEEPEDMGEEELEDEGDSMDSQGASDGPGFPPAARGARRTNHVCSIKVCYNLLSPNNPWKMCDSCRSRDRTARKIKALRESGAEVESLPSRAKESSAPDAEKKKVKKRRKKETKKVKGGNRGQGNAEAGPSGKAISSAVRIPAEQSSEAAATSTASNDATHAPAMAFLNPLLPDQTVQLVSASSSAPIDVPLGPDVEHIPEPAEAEQSFHTEAASRPVHTTKDATPPNPKPPRKRKPAKKKEKAKDSDVDTAAEGTSNTVAAPAAATLAPVASTSAAPHIQPPYHVPYYMPPPFAMPPYAPGRMGAPATMYARDPYAPTPMYQPPYPYPAYPYPPPPGYAFPPPYPIAPPPPHAQAQVSASGSSPQQTAQTPSQSQSPPQPQAAQPSGSTSAPAQVRAPPPFNPFAQPLDIASMYSTFSSRPKGDKPANTSTSVSTHTNQTPYGSEVAPPAPPPQLTDSTLKFTFNAKTGQAYSRPEPAPGFPRRRRFAVNPEEQVANKRQAVEVDGAMRALAVGQSGSDVQVGTAVVNGHGEGGDDSAIISICGNKNCHRVLPPNVSGNLCDKCREKVKKKQMKVKQRFKLEPKRIAGSGSIGGSHQSTPPA